MNIGCHVPISKGLDKAPEIAAKLECEVMQIFTHSPSGGPIADISEETAQNFKAAVKKYGIRAVYVHAPYYINLASKNNRVYYGSVSAIRKNLERASLLGAKYVMTHLGSSGDMAEKEMLERLKESFAKIFNGYGGSAELLIENSAGAGKIIGSDFAQIGKILKPTYDVGFKNRHRKSVLAGICLDTQHSFASGYDWKNDFDNCVETLDKNIGIKNIKLMHSNDSLTDLNSHKDRHSHIGKGKIGLEGFEKLVDFAQENGIDMICETAYPGVVEDVKILKKIRDAK